MVSMLMTTRTIIYNLNWFSLVLWDRVTNFAKVCGSIPFLTLA